MKILKTMYKVIKDDFKDARMLVGYAMDVRESGGDKGSTYGQELVQWAAKRLEHAKSCMMKMESYLTESKNSDMMAIGKMIVEDMKEEYEDIERFMKTY